MNDVCCFASVACRGVCRIVLHAGMVIIDVQGLRGLQAALGMAESKATFKVSNF